MKVHSSLNADYQYCERVIRQHSRSFYYAFSQLPAEKARAVYAIYAFCRIADDSVDENPSRKDQLTALEKLETDLVRFENGKEPDEPMWRALRDVFERYQMDLSPFYEQLRGHYMDLDFQMPKTLEQLEQYSYFVAGTVGRMLLPIIATENQQQLQESAIDLGIAMQLTNILRDIGEDYRLKKRIYLPRDILEYEQYSFQQLHQARINDSFISIWERLAQRAESLYQNYYRSAFLFDADSKMPVLASARIYEGILDEVRRNGYDCFSKKQAVSKRRMLSILQDIRLTESI